jgi:transcriptional regulator with XRE-family HTH domain
VAVEKKTLAKMFGMRVRAARVARDWSQAEFAELSSMTTNHVGVIERGESVPSLDTVEACAKAFGVRVGELVDEPMVEGPWIQKLVTMALAVPLHKRRLLLTLVAAIVSGVCIDDEEEKSPASELKRSKGGITHLMSHDAFLNDPKVAAILAVLRNRNPKQIEQALQILRALEG